ncbi:MAG TPA: TIGR02147 family protein [Bdellovibrionales bacterium]|nr:TIGR02147 family protein [Bdellovibrionales bacterium]
MIQNYFPDDPRVYLREELQMRKRRRASYSLRAFARDLSMSPSSLCEFLAGRQGLSKDRVTGISRRLNLSNDQMEHFWNLVEAQFGRSSQAKRIAGVKANQRAKNSHNRLTLERFQLISEWHHFVILEILGLDGKPYDLKDIAEILDLPIPTIRNSIRRMQTLDLVEEITTDTNTTYRVKSNLSVTGDEGENPAIKLAHQEMLGVHARAVDSKSVNDRQSISVVCSINQKDWLEFRRELKEVVFSVISRFAENTDPKDQVVMYSMQAVTLLPQNKKEIAP